MLELLPGPHVAALGAPRSRRVVAAGRNPLGIVGVLGYLRHLVQTCNEKPQLPCHLHYELSLGKHGPRRGFPRGSESLGCLVDLGMVEAPLQRTPLEFIGDRPEFGLPSTDARHRRPS